MLSHKRLQPGTRVRIVDQPIQMTLQAFTGVVLGNDKYDDYYIIQLDEPGVYHHADGHDELYSEIVENVDNIEVIAVPSFTL
jgi:hypothetical protein